MNPSIIKSMKANQAIIDKIGGITAARTTFIRQNTALFGPKQAVSATKTIAGRFVEPGQAKPKSTMVSVGESPDGFGKQILWAPEDKSIAAVIFLNAGDYLGVMVSGVKSTDTIEFFSCTGIASFAEETKNKGAGALIGLIAAGATVTSAAFGLPQLAPVIGAAEKFANTQFEEKKVKTKRRDPFGVDPSSGHKARQEGGVLVSLPEARQAFYSGNSDHKERWIKEPGTRDDAHRPDHVKKAFFLQAGSPNKRIASADGDILIYPWDHIFDDNFGYYRLHVLLKRGSGQNPVIE
ncbi:hypothetical protein [Polaromonas glacialis]|uniref:hypothetical protein n=1 Tax=Polaromonas glacialis TaxID=866564 RepID=UPI000495A302|nr:hypothetical protein [Polaromonas glacialis]